MVTAKIVSEKLTFPHRRLNLHEQLRRDAFSQVNSVSSLERRVATPQQSAPDRSTVGQDTPTSSAKSSPESGEPFNEQSYNAFVSSACGDALGALKSVVNPAGLAACYNIFLDEATGTFEADIRLYQVTMPTGDFTGISWRDFMLGMTISNAIISDPQRMPSASPAGPGNMLMVQDLRHIGKLNPDFQLTKLSP